MKCKRETPRLAGAGELRQ